MLGVKQNGGIIVFARAVPCTPRLRYLSVKRYMFSITLKYLYVVRRIVPPITIFMVRNFTRFERPAYHFFCYKDVLRNVTIFAGSRMRRTVN